MNVTIETARSSVAATVVASAVLGGCGIMGPGPLPKEIV